jgi:hypothetical protein
MATMRNYIIAKQIEFFYWLIPIIESAAPVNVVLGTFVYQVVLVTFGFVMGAWLW